MNLLLGSLKAVPGRPENKGTETKEKNGEKKFGVKSKSQIQFNILDRDFTTNFR